jgi:exodeoxyribonuclease V alpha subunit
LPPVGTGSVFLDLVRALEVSDAGDVVRLQHSFRADQALVPVR